MLFRSFQQVDLDVGTAVDVIVARTGVERVVLWGLCDAASAALMYAHTDARVAGLVLLNPWVHAVATEAKVRLKTYYLGRLRKREFWRKLVTLDLDWRDSTRSLWQYVRGALARSDPGGGLASLHFIERMRRGWSAFPGSTLVILSGDDLTAGEFQHLCVSDPAWRAQSQARNVRVVTVAGANHTFARAEWRAAVEQMTCAWVTGLSQGAEPQGR